jgi:ATP-binding cassette subfamily B protein
MVSTRLQAFYNPLIGFLPQLGLAAILFYGGRQVIDGQLSVGQFTAFYTYLLMLLSPMRTLGISLGMAQRATASGARLFQILDRDPRIVSPAGAPPLPPGSGQVELRDVELRYEGATQPRCMTSRWRSTRVPRWPSSARRARARPRWCSCSPGCTT